MELGADPWIPGRGVGPARTVLFRRTAPARTADRSGSLRQPWLPRGQRGGLRPKFRVRRAVVLPYALSTEHPRLLAPPGRAGIPDVLGDPRDSRLIRGPAGSVGRGAPADGGRHGAVRSSVPAVVPTEAY